MGFFRVPVARVFFRVGFFSGAGVAQLKMEIELRGQTNLGVGRTFSRFTALRNGDYDEFDNRHGMPILDPSSNHAEA